VSTVCAPPEMHDVAAFDEARPSRPRRARTRLKKYLPPDHPGSGHATSQAVPLARIESVAH